MSENIQLIQYAPFTHPMRLKFSNVKCTKISKSHFNHTLRMSLLLEEPNELLTFLYKFKDYNKRYDSRWGSMMVNGKAYHTYSVVVPRTFAKKLSMEANKGRLFSVIVEFVPKIYTLKSTHHKRVAVTSTIVKFQPSPTYDVGALVDTVFHNGWTPAKITHVITTKNKTSYKIHYIGYSIQFDTWVSPGDIKPYMTYTTYVGNELRNEKINGMLWRMGINDPRLRAIVNPPTTKPINPEPEPTMTIRPIIKRNLARRCRFLGTYPQ